MFSEIRIRSESAGEGSALSGRAGANPDFWSLSYYGCGSTMGSYSRDPFLQAIEGLGFGFVVMRAPDTLYCANSVFADIVESTVTDVEGRAARSFMDECNFRVFTEQQEQRRQGGSQPYDLRLLSSQGTPTRVYVFPTPLFEAAEFVGSCGLVLPCSQRSSQRPVGAVPNQVKATALALLRSSSKFAVRTRNVPRASEAFRLLSTSEKEVLERLTPSNSVEELAHELGTSVTKVRVSLLNIYDKYGVRNRIELLGLIHVLSGVEGTS